ncbi:MAG: hypothetical protein KC912_14780 [Proteobacteria bacterium]|nr:hypothetical protein [Pseudomonadota bacterium]
MTESRPIPKLRLLTILAVGVYLQVGPVTHQALGMQKMPGFKTWRMYRGFGQDICRVRFYEQRPDGTRADIDRFEVLRTTRTEAPRYITFIPSEAQVARTGETLCRKLRRPADLRVDGDCGSMHTWRSMDRLEGVNLCTLDEPRFRALERR